MSVNFKFKKDFKLDESKHFDVNVDMDFLDSKIRFSFKECNTKKYCIRKLKKGQLKKFYKKLGQFEEMTWSHALNLDHKKGFSKEKKKSPNYNLLKDTYEQYDNFFHFRIDNTTFRVFGTNEKDLLYILLIDGKGDINHK